MIAERTTPLTTEKSISRRIRNRGRGAVFTASEFADLATRSTVDWVLQVLTEKGIIRRISRGIYDYPIKSQIVGLVPPSPESIAKAITKRDGSRIQASGAYAANLLGLSEQIPAQIVFLTSLDERSLTVGNQEIVLKKTTPRIMKMSGRISGLITQSFKYLGKESITEEMIKGLQEKLTKQEKNILKQDISYPPAWIADYFRQIIS